VYRIKTFKKRPRSNKDCRAIKSKKVELLAETHVQCMLFLYRFNLNWKVSQMILNSEIPNFMKFCWAIIELCHEYREMGGGSEINRLSAGLFKVVKSSIRHPVVLL
jgi:hypothetical protein